MKSENVTFENRDGIRLHGAIDWPVDQHQGYHALALFAHCFTCGKNLKSARQISQALVENGIAVMRFDFTGLGASDGAFSDTTFASNVSDLIDAAAWLADNFAAPELLVGHSLGGTAVLAAAGAIDSVKAVASINAPADPTHVQHLFADRSADIMQDGEAEVLLAGRPFTIRKQFIEDLERHDLADAVHSMRKALLIMHSPIDETVEIENASKLFSHALHPKSFVSLDKADHLLSNPAHAHYAGRALAAWASQYLPAAEPPLAASTEAIVARTPATSFTTSLSIGGHLLTADEPASVGGNDTGPTPVQLLSAALASCTSMTLQMYARHKKLELDDVETAVEQRREPQPEGGDIVVFHRRIRLTGVLTAAQRERLLEIADRCPVHRTLTGSVRVTNELVGS